MLTQEQKKNRKTGIGGSDAPIIMGVEHTKYMNLIELYKDKTSDFIYEDEPNRLKHWGDRLEPLIREEYETFTGNKVQWSADTLRSDAYPFMLCHLDGWVEDQQIALEIKAPDVSRRKEFGKPGTEEYPEEFKIQLAHNCIVSKAHLGHLAVLIGGNDFRVYTYTRNLEYERVIIESNRNFWENHVVKRIPPSPRDLDEARSRWPESSDDIIIATDDVLESFEALKKISKYISDLELKESEMKARICQLLKDASELRSEDGRKLATWKTQETNRFQTKTFAEQYPDLVREFTRATKSRVFRVL